MKIYTLEEILNLPMDNAFGAEMSYRRGVHQALSILKQFIEDDTAMSPHVSVSEVISYFEWLASEWRNDGKPHPLLMNEISDAVEYWIAERHNDEVSRLVSLGEDI